MDSGTIVALVAVAFFALLILGMVGQAKTDQKRKELHSNPTKKQGFNSTKTVVKQIGFSEDFQGISVDNNSKRVLIFSKDKENHYKFSDIIECEAVIDGNTVVKTSRMNQLGKAAVGGILFGGVGAIIGALNGRKEEVKKIKSVALKILVNDLENPVHTINFIEKAKPTPIDKVAEEAQQWSDLFAVIIAHDKNATS